MPEPPLDRKAMVRRYKETPRPAGVYRVMNTRTGKSLVGASVDAPAMLNRLRTQLELGGHPNRALQRDWNAEGADAFTCEVLDLLEPADGGDHDALGDLRTLEALWVEKLGLTGDRRY